MNVRKNITKSIDHVWWYTLTDLSEKLRIVRTYEMVNRWESERLTSAGKKTIRKSLNVQCGCGDKAKAKHSAVMEYTGMCYVCGWGMCDAKIKLSHYEIGDGVVRNSGISIKMSNYGLFWEGKNTVFSLSLFEIHEQSLRRMSDREK